VEGTCLGRIRGYREDVEGGGSEELEVFVEKDATGEKSFKEEKRLPHGLTSFCLNMITENFVKKIEIRLGLGGRKLPIKEKKTRGRLNIKGEESWLLERGL